jgi:hypothetical protein
MRRAAMKLSHDISKTTNQLSKAELKLMSCRTLRRGATPNVRKAEYYCKFSRREHLPGLDWMYKTEVSLKQVP